MLPKLRQVSGRRSLGFDAEGVAWLDGYVERQRVLDGLGPETLDGLIENLGCFLGECIIAMYGGRWTEVDGEWAVEFSPGNAVMPFGKLAEQFENGSSDSVRSMVELIPILFPPWWRFRVLAGCGRTLVGSVLPAGSASEGYDGGSRRSGRVSIDPTGSECADHEGDGFGCEGGSRS